MHKIRFKIVFYNPRTDELGTGVMIDRMLLIDTGLKTGYKAYTTEWAQIGFI